MILITMKLEPKMIWLRSARMSPYGEGLFDKVFERTDRFLSNFKKVIHPRVLRFRISKQHHEEELIEKGIFCKGGTCPHKFSKPS